MMNSNELKEFIDASDSFWKKMNVVPHKVLGNEIVHLAIQYGKDMDSSGKFGKISAIKAYRALYFALYMEIPDLLSSKRAIESGMEKAGIPL